jgi:hypothetical protein
MRRAYSTERLRVFFAGFGDMTSFGVLERRGRKRRGGQVHGCEWRLPSLQVLAHLWGQYYGLMGNKSLACGSLSTIKSTR